MQQEPNVGLAVRYAMRAFTRALNSAAAEHDLTSAEFRLLRTLAVEPGSTQSELAASAAMDRPYVTTLVTRMTGRGLLVTGPDPADRRRSRVAMTDRGCRVFEELAAETERVNGAATEGVPPEELGTFLAVLATITANLDPGD